LEWTIVHVNETRDNGITRNNKDRLTMPGEVSMRIPGVNGKNEYQVVLRSGSMLNDLSIEFPGVHGKNSTTKRPSGVGTDGVVETQQ
jgi:hypothetical protein